MTEHERPEVECRECGGEGLLKAKNSMFEATAICGDCNGSGYRPATDDELADMAEAAWERAQERAQEGEPPLSLDKQHRRNWQIKQGLK